MGSKFVTHSKLWLLILPIILAFILPAVLPSSDFDVTQSEISNNEKILGIEKNWLAAERAEATFTKWFVSTRLVSKSMASKGVFARERNDSGLHQLGNTWAEGFWKLLYRSLYRLNVAAFFWLGATVFFLACFVDGYTRRQIKSESAGYSNARSFHLATHGMIVTLGVLLLLPLWPFAFTPSVWLVATLIGGGLMWWMGESFQTGG